MKHSAGTRRLLIRSTIAVAPRWPNRSRPSPRAKQKPRRAGPSGVMLSVCPSDQAKPIQRPPAAVATQLRIDITAIIRAMRPPAVASERQIS